MTGRRKWQHLRSLRQELLDQFPGDDFLEKLLEGVWLVGRDKRNPIRGNLVASALREVFGHLLHSLAPDKEVRKCVWFEQDPNTPTVTRRQKARYIVQAGLPEEFVADVLNFEVDEYVAPLLEAFQSLNKATHVRPETIVYDSAEVRGLIAEVLEAFLHLSESAVDARSDLVRAIEAKMHDAVFDNLIAESIDELEELSTHTTVDGHFIEKVEVIELNAEQVVYEVIGEVGVELQYGSNSDVRKDIGMRMGDSYPYRAIVLSKAGLPLDIGRGDVELQIDNSSFFE